ncbi:AAA family ATPase [Paenibacillus xylanexedens]|uniref:AAA family ATPase n=1 Tax=Paenibacillus xylanexedens TaxID=528191 RepID=UPI00119CFA32|nr:AAA family ATPase [Paenibacillus xylanexedens]
MSKEEINELKGTHIHAKYNEQVNPKNQGNPFIEALPSRVDISQFIDVLYSTPPLDSKYNTFSVEDRLEFVQQIRPDFWLPLPSHYEKYRNLYSMIKIGYQSRNPMYAIYNRQFSIGWEKIYKVGVDENGANLAGNVHTAQSLAEIAINGYGKTQIYERMLIQLFPQVIHHNRYQERALTQTQLVWLKVECPYNKSVGTFCKIFYFEVDKLLGSQFYERFAEKPGTIDKLVIRMISTVAQVNLGVLVIDEIQRIQKAYSGGEDNMIDFITQLVNTLGVPVILIGSFKALYLFKDSLANTRKCLPNGYAENISGYMLKDSWEWNHFIENLWDLQYTKTYTEITQEIKNKMHYYSMGIPDIAVKLFMHVQSRIIVNGGEERIRLSDIREVAERSLNMVQPIFNRIRSGDPLAYKELDDIKPDWVPLNGYIKEASHRISVHGSLAKDHARILQEKRKEEILSKLNEFAQQLVQDSTEAEDLVNKVYNASSGMGDITLMFSQIARLVVDKSEYPKKISNKSKKSVEELPKYKRSKKVKPELATDDIRYVVQLGYSKGLTTEEALEEKGYIREVNELHNLIVL